MLAWTIYSRLPVRSLRRCCPRSKPAPRARLALVVAVAGFAIAIAGFVAGAGHGRVVIADVPWVPVDGHPLHACRGRHQPRSCAADWTRRSRGRSVQLEHRAADQRVLRLLSGADRRRLRRLSQLRPVPAVRVLRDRHRAEVFSDRHLGIDAARIRGDEAGACTRSSGRRWC